MPQTRVYHYINPANGNHISSLLPPDHPEMVCLQEGSHVEETKFGLLGALSLSFFFSLFVERSVLMRGLLDRHHRGHHLVPVRNRVVYFR